jgi:hypothetical protein
MRELSAVVERIRLVRAARARFLRLWKLSRLRRLPAYLAGAPSALDRLAADVARAGSVPAHPGTVGTAPFRLHDAPAPGGRTTWLRRGGLAGDVG